MERSMKGKGKLVLNSPTTPESPAVEEYSVEKVMDRRFAASIFHIMIINFEFLYW